MNRFLTPSLAPLAKLFCVLLMSSTVLAEDAPLQATFSNGMSLQLESQLQPVALNRMHSWQIFLSDSNGSPVSGAAIEVIGGMPEHDHGLPTQPLVTGEPQPGTYILQGMRFHMPGLWQLQISIESGDFSETTLLEFTL